MSIQRTSILSLILPYASAAIDGSDEMKVSSTPKNWWMNCSVLCIRLAKRRLLRLWVVLSSSAVNASTAFVSWGFCELRVSQRAFWGGVREASNSHKAAAREWVLASVSNQVGTYSASGMLDLTVIVPLISVHMMMLQCCRFAVEGVWGTRPLQPSSRALLRTQSSSCEKKWCLYWKVV